jgi:hypothetical protein
MDAGGGLWLCQSPKGGPHDVGRHSLFPLENKKDSSKDGSFFVARNVREKGFEWDCLQAHITLEERV